ncbi:MAG: FeoA family protein [Candidatus Nanopelagicales bacterium]
MSDIVTLTEVEKGSVAVIVQVDGPDDSVVARLSHLGFLPGTRIKVVRRAPLGDPTVFELRGNQMSLRKRESSTIKVTVEEVA